MQRMLQCRASRSLVCIVVTISTMAILSGCGSSGVDHIQVHGKVTFGGDAPLADGSLTFLPIKTPERFPARPARANFSQGDGTFTAMSVRPDDGLVPGTYIVEITCWKRRPTEEIEGISYVPAYYSPPELIVSLDGPNPIEVEYKIPALDH